MLKILCWLSHLIKPILFTDTGFKKYIMEQWKKNFKEIEEQTQNLIYALSFSSHFMEKLVKNTENLEKLLMKQTLFYLNCNSCLAFGMLNLNYENDFSEIFKFNENCIENIMLIISTYSQILSYFKTLTKSNINDNNLRDNSTKKLDSIHSSYRDFALKLDPLAKTEKLGNVENFINFFKNQLK